MTALDLGHGHTLKFFKWAPDRDLNPQYVDQPDIEKAGAIIEHPHAQTGEPCSGGIHFDVPGAEHLSETRWRVISWDPLTLDPSIQCDCGDHGHIDHGKWVPA